MDKLVIKKIGLWIYLAIEIGLYISFLVLDTTFNTFNLTSSIIKYSSIIINLIFIILLSIFFFNKERLITIFIVIFTLISDYFLLFESDYNYLVVGLITFNIVQFLYFFRFHLLSFNKNKFIISLVLRIVLFIIAFLFIYFLLDKSYFNTLNILAVFYFINLVFNFLDPLISNYKDRKNQLLVVGFFLFILCDINVGLVNLNFNNVIFSILMWVFYLPSQVILLYSVYKDDKRIGNIQ